MAERVGFEPTN